jgi:signal transduction histidine kinase
LDELGLEAAIAALCERASRHGLQVDSSIELAFEQGREPSRHTPELESAIYRIIQEALTNATKHGHASQAVIKTWEHESTVGLSVRDDGDGFDPTSRTTGFGLLGIHERVELLHGAVHIESSPGAGTTVSASFPVQRRHAAVTTTSHPLGRARGLAS